MISGGGGGWELAYILNLLSQDLQEPLVRFLTLFRVELELGGFGWALCYFSP